MGLQDTCIGWKPEIYLNMKLISRRWAWNFTSFSSFSHSNLYLFSAFLPIFLTWVCMFGFFNSLEYLHERNYSISTAPLVMGLRRSGDQGGLSMVVCLIHNHWRTCLWLICTDSPASIIQSGITGKAPFYLFRIVIWFWFFFSSNNFDAGDWLLYEVILTTFIRVTFLSWTVDGLSTWRFWSWRCSRKSMFFLHLVEQF